MGIVTSGVVAVSVSDQILTASGRVVASWVAVDLALGVLHSGFLPLRVFAVTAAQMADFRATPRRAEAQWSLQEYSVVFSRRRCSRSLS